MTKEKVRESHRMVLLMPKGGSVSDSSLWRHLLLSARVRGGHQPPPSLNYHLKKTSFFFSFFPNFFWVTFLNTTKINIVMIFWKFIYISRNIGKSVETWGSGWGDTYILMGGIFCGGETTPPPKLPQFFSENIFFAWLRTKIIYETTGIFRKIRFSFFSRMTNLAPQDMKFQHSKSMSSVSRWLRTQKNGGIPFMNQLEFFEKIRFFVFLKNDQLGTPGYEISALKINV